MPEISPDFTTAICARIGLDRYITAESALGGVYVAWSADGVSAVRQSGDEEAFEAWYAERFERRCVPAIEDDSIATAARAKLRGEDADVPIDLHECSEFEQRVLRKAAEIKGGGARPYSWVAREIGSPGATRAVGNALGRNPVPLLIPCHRVVRSDYSAGGYVFGGEAKRALLEREGVNFGAIGEVVRRGFRYVGCDDGYFCLPSCGDIASRLDEPGFLGLHSLEEAHEHGLRPCRTCRPMAA
ncbi:MAG TPA: methylated-DNA--[protein]-cysteine S-methyltransferase [Candidatus Limnocylindrales bacterium]|nr:methylated-DNA--[protein]-cysteine S-methyltransferase [Candidatus Limnocylindrales bacterium]